MLYDYNTYIHSVGGGNEAGYGSSSDCSTRSITGAAAPSHFSFIGVKAYIVTQVGLRFYA